MARAPSLQWRLSLGLVIGVTLMWIVATTLTALNVGRDMNEVFDSALEKTGQRILPLAVSDILDRDKEGLLVTVADLRGTAELLTFVVRDNKGRVLLKSHDADPEIFPVYSGVGFVDTDKYRIFFDSALQESLTIAVAEPLNHRREALWEIVMSLLWPLPFLIPISILGVWSLVRHAMRPVRVFENEIKSRGSGDLSAAETEALPREMEPVGQAVNLLLERLRRAMEAERSFTANSAHELRTPVAAALAQTQRLIAETDDRGTRERGQDIEIALRRLSSLSEKLMQLAKSEGGGLIRNEKGDVRPVLELVLSDFCRDAETSGRLKIDLSPDPVLSDMDADALAILARNLIENALKHAESGSLVHVTLGGDCVFSVLNECAALSQADLARLTRPFERGPTEASGTGLGLAIVAAVASGSGHNLSLKSPANGKKSGFEAAVDLG